MTHGEKAVANFKSGFNCAQAVFLAFEDLHGMDHSTAMRLTSTFGGGIGKLREVCGCMTGMIMTVGILYGYEDVNDAQAKIDTYGIVQKLAKTFEKEKGSIICRDLLGLKPGEDLSEPAVRTEEYYRSRPCAGLCKLAADILDEYIAEHPYPTSTKEKNS